MPVLQRLRLALPLLGTLLGDPLDAQAPRAFRHRIERGSATCSAEVRERHCLRSAQAPSTPAPAIAVALSAVVPGSGQALLGVNRALPYMAVEAFGWVAYVHHSQDYRRRRNSYRDLAARVARVAFAAVRPNGDFAYYEHMTHYRQSGRFDVIPGGGLQPESDTLTYNGAMWLLARQTFWTDPRVAPDTGSESWKRAETFYRSRAYDNNFRWSWTGAPDEYAEFLELIDRSNEASRRALLDLGVIIANHALSMVDAYVTIRLRQDMARDAFAVEASVPFFSAGRKQVR